MIISCVCMKMMYISISAKCIYNIYVCMCDISMTCMIWMLIQVYLMFCLDSISIVGSSLRLGGVGSVLLKVRGNLSVVC